MSGAIELMKVPAGSSVELLDDGTVMAFLPDGSARRAWMEFGPHGITVMSESYPPIKLTIGKAGDKP